MAGGEDSFGSGGYTGTRLEKILPVRFDTEKKRDQPALALALVIDRSGSMTGEKLELAKDAAKATAELLGADDLIGVVAFDSQPTPIVRLQRAANRAAHRAATSRACTAGGGTNILPALKEAYDELDPAHAKVKHVILLTDGQASYDGISRAGRRDGRAQDHRLGGRRRRGRRQDAAHDDRRARRRPLLLHAGRRRTSRRSSPRRRPRWRATSLVEEQVGVHVAEARRAARRRRHRDGAAAARLRVHQAEAARPTDPGERPRRADPGALARRARASRGLDQRRQEPLGGRVAQAGPATASSGRSWSARPCATGRAAARPQLRADRPSRSAARARRGRRRRRRRRFVVGPGDHAAGDRSRASGRQARAADGGDGAPAATKATSRSDRYGSFLLRAVHSAAGSVVAESTGAVSLPYPREYLALPADEGVLARVAAATGGGARLWTRGAAVRSVGARAQVCASTAELWP